MIFNVTMVYKTAMPYFAYTATNIEAINGTEAKSIARNLALIEVGPEPPKKMIVDLVSIGAPKIDEIV